MVYIKNPVVIMAGETGPTSSNVKITNYDNGVISGTNFGTTTGTVYLLDRDTHSYSSLPVNSWGNNTIVLTTPIDTTSIEGNTCFYIKTASGLNSTKYMVYGNAVSGYAIVYVRDNSENITKIYMTTNQIGNLSGSAANYGRDITVGDQTVNTANIVGIQFGTSATSHTMATNFLASMPNLNQPIVIPEGFTATTSSTYFMRYDYTFDCPLILPTTLQRFGNYAMQYCYSFNQPMDISNFKYLNFSYFMSNCQSFNQELKLPTSLTTKTLGTYFLAYCRAFNQPLTFPSDMTSFGSYFLGYCGAFNSTFNIPNTISTIGTYFLYQCYAFNQALDFSDSAVTTIGNYFMNYCPAFNSSLKFKSTMTAIPNYFMNYCSAFNQPLDVSNITSYGNYFMQFCYSFNQPLSIKSTATSIGAYFLASCYSFSKHLTIPSTVTSIGNYFMYEHYAPFKITVECTPMTAANATGCLAQSTLNCGSYAQGITIYGSKRAEWIDRLPDSTTSPYRKLLNGGA